MNSYESGFQRRKSLLFDDNDSQKTEEIEEVDSDVEV